MRKIGLLVLMPCLFSRARAGHAWFDLNAMNDEDLRATFPAPPPVK